MSGFLLLFICLLVNTTLSPLLKSAQDDSIGAITAKKPLENALNKTRWDCIPVFPFVFACRNRISLGWNCLHLVLVILPWYNHPFSTWWLWLCKPYEFPVLASQPAQRGSGLLCSMCQWALQHQQNWEDTMGKSPWLTSLVCSSRKDKAVL